MYSERIIQRSVERIEAGANLKLKRYEFPEVEEWQDRLSNFLGPDLKPRRALSADEKAFILNEQILCQVDFSYFAERYWKVEADSVVSSGIVPMRLGNAQKLLLDKIAKAEDEEYDKIEHGNTSDGILIVDHKARQVWHTALMRAISMHRLLFYRHQRGIAGTVDEPKKTEIYKRDRLIGLESLPFYLKQELDFDVKNEHIQLAGTKSFLDYIASNKKFSPGQSQQFDIGHLTECSEWQDAYRIELDLLPSFGQSPRTVFVLESRANGRGGWWYDFSESTRKGLKPRWRYCFIPWYSEPQKYRRTPPAHWTPNEVSVLHAKKVYETSPEFIGKALYLSREQLYWWETTRDEYVQNGSLNFFLTSYCATPAESFQHSNQSSFSAEVLDKLRLQCAQPVPYEFEYARN